MYQVQAVAFALGCTPALIYSHFKDRKWPIQGGLTDAQLDEIEAHLRSKKRRKPYKYDLAEVQKVNLHFAGRIGQQQALNMEELSL